MKQFGILLVFVSLTAQLTCAQQITNTITQFDIHTGLVWSNSVTNTCSLVEYCSPTLMNGVWTPFTPWFLPDTGGRGTFPPDLSFTNGPYDASTKSNLATVATSCSNLWAVMSWSQLGPSSIFFRVRSTQGTFTNFP
jgi:hypothetical protein